MHANLEFSWSVGDLATQRPASIAVLHRLGIDFCCGGRTALTTACETAGVGLSQLLAEVQAVEQSAENRAANDAHIDTMPMSELIDFVLNRFHVPEKEALERAGQLAERVGRVHANNPDIPGAALAAEVAAFRDDLFDHMAKEEQVLFPWILSGRGNQAQAPISVMLREHDDAAASLERLRQLTKQFSPPEGACGTVRALYAELAALDLDIRTHMHTENNVLFPRALRGES